MLNTFAPALPQVNPAAVELFPESYIDDAFADLNAKLAEMRARFEADAARDEELMSDEEADEMAGLALAESRLEMGLMAW